MARFFIYSNRIRLSFVKGKTLADAVDQTLDESKAFEDFIVGALETLKATNTGARLLREIDGTPHVCTLFAGKDNNDDNCAKSYPCDVPNGLARMIVNFRPFQKNMPQSAKSNKNPLDGKGRPLPSNESAPLIKAYKDLKDDYRIQASGFGLPTTPAEGGKELYKVLKRAQQMGGHAKVLQAVQHCNLTMQNLRDACLGQFAFDDNTYYKLCFMLYDYLTPGPGCSTQVRMQLPGVFEAKNADIYKSVKTRLLGKDKKAWRKVTAILLGHELIHAWRMMTGRRVVDDGYDEEAMTVGFGPFSNWPLTENALRRDFKVSTRPTYQPLSRYFAPLMKELMNNPGVEPEIVY